MATGEVLPTDRTKKTASSNTSDRGIPPAAPRKNDAFSSEGDVLDTSGWDKIWTEAYKKVKEDPKDAIIFTKLEMFLDNEDETNDFGMYPLSKYQFVFLQH